MSAVYTSELADCRVHDCGWVDLPSGVTMSRLPLWDRSADLFARLGHGPAGELLARFGLRLPTVAEYDELHDLAIHIDPYTLPTMAMLSAAGVNTGSTAAIDSYRNEHMRSRVWCDEHDREVFARLAAVDWHQQPVANAGKHWATGGVIVGWWRSDGTRIQNPSSFHASVDTYTDYATTFHAVCIHDDADDADGITELAPDTDPSPGSQPPPTLAADDWRTLRLGMKGGDVKAWQGVLIVDGYDLGSWADDGDFGKRTHNATVSWQGERGLVRDGIVGKATQAAIGTDPIEREPARMVTPISFVEAEAFRYANRTAVDWVVVHTSEAREGSTTAEALQSYAANMQGRRASWHYAIDDDSIAQSVLEKHVGFACPGLNRRGVQIELAGFARQSAADWRDPFSTRMRELLAELAAGICSRWSIPVQHIDAKELDEAHAAIEAGERVPEHCRGITTHSAGTRSAISRGRTTHTDPGEHFPMAELIDKIGSLV